MDRRAFLKTISLGIVAAAAPAILVPERTIIDMNPYGYRFLMTPHWITQADMNSALARIRRTNENLSVDLATGLFTFSLGVVSKSFTVASNVFYWRSADHAQLGIRDNVVIE